MKKLCPVCKNEIYFVMNDNGNWVARTKETHKPHYEDCKYSKQYRKYLDAKKGLPTQPEQLSLFDEESI